jgi:acetyl-CoA C-acetyltransferase
VTGALTDDRIPVIVGVAQLRDNRERSLDSARSPLDLLTDVIGRAATDSGTATLAAQADTIGIVNVLGWSYDGLAALVNTEIGGVATQLIDSPIGGNQPAKLLDDAAAAIAAGDSRIAVLGGVEAVASMRAFLAAGKVPDWTPGGFPNVNVAEIASEIMLRYQLAPPVRAYPLYENGLRAHLGQTFDEAYRSAAQLFADFTTVAATQPAAWDPQVRTAEEIGTVTERNRLVCQPYPVRMNAQIAVNQAAAIIVTSVAAAREAGIDESRWVYVRSGAGAADCDDLLSRVDFHSDPAMAAVLDESLQRAGVAAADIDVLDLYSCFPIVPKLAASYLDRPLGADLTATGGLSAFGGPGNNYSMHALAAVTDRLRVDPGIGLVYANGGMLTKHHAVVLDSVRPQQPFRGGDVDGEFATEHPRVVEPTEGTGTIETYTVEFNRDGTPKRGWVIGRTDTGDRFPAIVTDAASMAELARTDLEPIGRRGIIGTIGEDEDEKIVGLTSFIVAPD